jgi:hypothetical protein
MCDVSDFPNRNIYVTIRRRLGLSNLVGRSHFGEFFMYKRFGGPIRADIRQAHCHRDNSDMAECRALQKNSIR